MALSLTLASAGGGGVGATPPRVFLEWPPNRWADRAEILHSLWGILCATFGKKILTGSGQVTELWRHKRNNLRPTFQGNRVFSHGTCCHWLEWGHYAWFRSEHDQMWPLTLHDDLPKVIRGHWPWLTPYIPIVANLAVFGVSWGPETEYVANFLHGHVYSASLHYPMSIGAIDLVCPQAILPMRVTLYPSGTLCVTYIPSRNCNDTLYCWELNGEHAGENRMSLRSIVFEIW